MLQTITAIPGYHLYGLLLVIAVSAGIHLSLVRHRDLDRRQVAEVVTMYAIGLVGFNGITSFFVHTVWADWVATSIGWPAGNPFQYEVAGANLAIGLIGYLGFWRRDFWLPFIIAKFAFSWTAGVVHVLDIVQHGNFAVNNAGPILYWDFLVPPLLLALYLLQRRDPRSEPDGSARTRPLAG